MTIPQTATMPPSAIAPDRSISGSGRLGTGVVTADAGWPFDLLHLESDVEVLQA